MTKRLGMFLGLGFAGVLLLLTGLAWDAVAHANDPSLAGREGIFTLGNPGHLLLGLGIGLVLDTAAWDFGQLWVLLGLGLFAGAFLIGAVWQSRTAIAATRAAERADDQEARRQLGRWSLGYLVVVVLLVAAAWDMTTKPGL